MTRFLVNSYEPICEIALWVFFIGMAIGGFKLGGVGGALLGLIVAFIFGVFFIAPFAMIEDIRKSVLRLERVAEESRTSSAATTPTAMAPSRASLPASPPVISRTLPQTEANNNATPSLDDFQVNETIKAYRGRKLLKSENGVSVDGVEFETLEGAMTGIDKMDLPSDEDIRRDFSIGDEISEISGQKVTLTKAGFRVRGIDFPTFSGALAYIDKLS